MKKYRAIEAMEAGKRVAHRNFSPDEWMIIKDDKMLFEDGVICSQAEFWKLRTDRSWDDDYSYFTE